MDYELPVTTLTPELITEENFAAFGAVLRSEEDGTPFTSAEAKLDVSRGTPRFYLMHLADKKPAFRGVTRHRQTTQSLLSVGGKPWLLAVAPPGDVEDPDARPAPEDVRAFVVPGDVAVLMERGTWHSGPHFLEDEMSFANLELADTNKVDHQTHWFHREDGITFAIEPVPVG